MIGSHAMYTLSLSWQCKPELALFWHQRNLQPRRLGSTSETTIILSTDSYMHFELVTPEASRLLHKVLWSASEQGCAPNYPSEEAAGRFESVVHMPHSTTGTKIPCNSK